MARGLIDSAQRVAAAGRGGDTMLAHINPAEASMLRSAGGTGTRNPKTGLPEYSFWTSLRDAFESVVVVVANYYLPGSALVTTGLASKGSQKELGSPLGRVATLASGAAGGVEGNLANYGKVAGSISGGTAVSDASTWAQQTLSGAQDWATTVLNGGQAAPAADVISSTADSIPSLSGAGPAADLGADAGQVATTSPVDLSGPTSSNLTGTESAMNIQPGAGQNVVQMQPPAAAPPGTDGTGGFDAAQNWQGIDTGAGAQPNLTPQTIIEKMAGLGNKAIDFANKNPGAAIAAGGMIAQGVGGIFSGMTAAEIEQKKIELAKQTPELQTQAALRARQAGNAGAYMPVGPNPIDPATGRPLGTVQYPTVVPGLINGAGR